ncbi:PHP domain-containing protein [Patescibacteria group bacterium AH-259-L07]|nr:PHP domain-containing protein [Patescibacteria group bacterium AH-259-L07]
MIDLHIHSYYSDGVYSPKELVQCAKELGLSTVCLTDHNGIDGVEEFLTTGQSLGMKVISGVEIYSYLDVGGLSNNRKHIHILGYDFDTKNKALNKALKKLQKRHIPQVKTTIKALQEHEWNIDEKKVFDTKATYIGSATIAGVIIKDSQNWERIQKDFKNRKIIPITEIIGKYFFKAYGRIYEESEISIEKAITLIKNAGGKIVLAHPGQHLSWEDEDIIVELKQIGLDGIEAVTSHHSWQEIEHWQIVAKELDLMITVGSDFHGYVPKEWDFIIRGPWDYFFQQCDRYSRHFLNLG